jgi:hypothetical protein
MSLAVFPHPSRFDPRPAGIEAAVDSVAAVCRPPAVVVEFVAAGSVSTNQAALGVGFAVAFVAAACFFFLGGRL